MHLLSTPCTVPDAPPEELSVSDISPTSAFLSWVPPSYEDQNGVIIQYAINVTVQETGEELQWTSTTNFLEVIDLEPYSTYVCIFAALTSVGQGPFSTVPLTFATLQDSE